MSRSSHDAGHYCKQKERWVYFRAPDGGAAICPSCGEAVTPQPVNLEGVTIETGRTIPISKERMMGN